MGGQLQSDTLVRGDYKTSLSARNSHNRFNNNEHFGE